MRQKENRDVQMLTVRVPKDLHEALRTLAFVQKTTINDIVIRSVADYMGSEGHQKAVEGLLGRAQEKWRVALDKLADM
jgi:predicted transcriptional regulator